MQSVKRSRFFRVPLRSRSYIEKRSGTPKSLLLKKGSGTPKSLFHEKSALFSHSFFKKEKKSHLYTYMNLEIQKKSYAKNWVDWIQSPFTFKNILTTGVMERFLEKKWVKKEWHSQIAPLENREWHSQITLSWKECSFLKFFLKIF